MQTDHEIENSTTKKDILISYFLDFNRFKQLSNFAYLLCLENVRKDSIIT
jgi:hypothetical protein